MSQKGLALLVRRKDRGCKYASALGEDGTMGEEVGRIDACKAKNLVILQQYQIIFKQDFGSPKTKVAPRSGR